MKLIKSQDQSIKKQIQVVSHSYHSSLSFHEGKGTKQNYLNQKHTKTIRLIPQKFTPKQDTFNG